MKIKFVRNITSIGQATKEIVENELNLPHNASKEFHFVARKHDWLGKLEKLFSNIIVQMIGPLIIVILTTPFEELFTPSGLGLALGIEYVSSGLFTLLFIITIIGGTLLMVVVHEFFHAVATTRHMKSCHIFISPNVWSVVCPRWLTKSTAQVCIILPVAMVSLIIIILFYFTSSVFLLAMFSYINIVVSFSDISNFIRVQRQVPKDAQIFHSLVWYQP